MAYNLFRQSFFIPSPPITEKNTPDQTGRVHLITGGYTGCGLELAKILYAANGTIYIAGRSAEKASTALDTIKAYSPTSSGSVSFLQLDLSDLRTIKPAVEEFKRKESHLHVLTNNAGVMEPPAGSLDALGEDLQLSTNVYGPFLLTKLLYPMIQKTAAQSPPNTCRVSWAGSIAVDLTSYRPGGVHIDSSGKPIHANKSQVTNYGMTKAANLWLASEYAKRYSKDDGVVQLCFNPGNLQTELTRHYGYLKAKALSTMLLYPSVFGGYTELYCAVAPELRAVSEAQFVVPWGRVGGFRSDIAEALKGGGGEGGREGRRSCGSGLRGIRRGMLEGERDGDVL